MIKAAKIIVKQCLGVKKNENVLIITDKNKLKIAKAIFKESIKITKTKLTVIPIGNVDGEEPPKEVANEMKNYDVVIAPTTKSITHTKARRNASKAGARIATMPGITEEIMKRAIPLDYYAMGKVNQRLVKLLGKTSVVRVTTELGTDITMNIKGRYIDNDHGIYNKKGLYGNLPAGEVCVAPVEGKSNGVFIIDGSILYHLVEEPIKVLVKNGYAIRIEGGKDAKKLNGVLRKYGREAYNIAELGIGTNPKTKITGNVLEDEKCLKTAHIAFGNNKSYGGKIDVPIHLDGIIKKPTIMIDNKLIIKNGEFVK